MGTEMVSISREKLHRMEAELEKLREKIKEIDPDSHDSEEDSLLRQAKASLEDLRAGRIRRIS